MNEINLKNTSKQILPGILDMGGSNPGGDKISFTNYYMEWNGKPWLPVMGEFHYSRFPFLFWEEEILKMKAGGVQVVATYAIWNHHEEESGIFDFSGSRNLRAFIGLCKKHDLLAWLRIGPFCHGEVRNGGMPDWLYGQPFEVRSNDERYLARVRSLYQEYAGQIKGLFFKDGGPIIGVQLENEFMQSGAPWETTHNTAMEYVPRGSGGEEHMRILKRIAVEAGIDVPVYSCTAWGSPVPEGELLPVIGGGYAFYAWEDDPTAQKPTGNYLFSNLHQKGNRPYDGSKVPYAGCETGGGMQVFYRNRPIVPPETVEAVSVIQMGSGANVMGFYMYHGGSNPVGRHSFLNEYKCPRISYDFQAPLREFGQVSESYRRLKRHFLFLQEFGGSLAPMGTFLPENASSLSPGSTDTLRFAVRIRDKSGFVFLNNYQDHVEMKDLFNQRIRLELDDETVVIPAGGDGFTVSKNSSAILPFNLSLDGICMKYSTCQLLTRLEVDGVAEYFFFAHDGIHPEHAIASPDISQIKAEGGTVRRDKEVTFVDVVPGTGSVVDIVGVNGCRVRIITLTNEQSLRFWKAKIWGRDRVFISDSDLIFNGDEINLKRTGDENMCLSVHPVDETALAVGGQSLPMLKDGIFACFTMCCRPKQVDPQVERISGDKAFIQFSPGSFDGVNDIFLRVDYVGDTGSAFIDGQFVHDNFWNGTIWEIGLRRFLPRILEKGLLLKITAKEKSKVSFTEMAAIKVDNDSGDATVFQSITVVPEYKCIVRKKG